MGKTGRPLKNRLPHDTIIIGLRNRVQRTGSFRLSFRRTGGRSQRRKPAIPAAVQLWSCPSRHEAGPRGRIETNDASMQRCHQVGCVGGVLGQQALVRITSENPNGCPPRVSLRQLDLAVCTVCQ